MFSTNDHTRKKNKLNKIAPCAWRTFAVVGVRQFVAGSAADLSLAAERTLGVDAALAQSAVAGAQPALVDVCGITGGGTWKKTKNYHRKKITCKLKQNQKVFLQFGNCKFV